MPKYNLDTDILTLYRRGHVEVTRRILSAVPGEVVTNVITAEEQLTGWYTAARRATKPPAIEHAYKRLGEVIEFFTGISILPFTQAAIARYIQLQSLKLNIGKYDLRIAAIVLEAGAIVVSRNVRDSGRVPGLAVEDWSVPPGP
jgi:tRNA(fMet)-specific endonuclease VapC